MRRLIPLFLLLGGCATQSPPGTAQGAPPVNLAEEFQLALGATVSLHGTPYSLTFERVIEDSRCAVGVVCIWEGNARISVEMLAVEPGPGNPATFLIADQLSIELNTSSRFPAKKSERGYQVELRRLDPAPRADIPTTGYVATLRVTR